MAFVVNVLKEDRETKKTLNIQILIDYDSQLFVRKFLEKAGLMILTFKDFYTKPETFGPNYIIITHDNAKIRIIGDKDISPAKLCAFFKKLGYTIDEVNNFSTPISPEQAKKVIDDADLDIESEKVTESPDSASKRKQAEQEMYQNNRKVQKCRMVAERIADKVDDLFYNKKVRMTEKEIRDIKDRVEELKKVKMGANYEKMKNMLQIIMLRLDTIEEEFYRDQKDFSQPLFLGTNVTVNELDKEITMFDASRQRLLFGGKAPKTKQYYVALGEALPYIKFIWKDLWIAVKTSFPYIYRIFDFLFFVYLSVTLALGVSVLIIPLLGKPQYLNSVYYALITMGIIGGLNYLCSLIKTKKPTNVIFLLIAIPVVYLIVIYFIKTTFALS